MTTVYGMITLAVIWDIVMTSPVIKNQNHPDNKHSNGKYVAIPALPMVNEMIMNENKQQGGVLSNHQLSEVASVLSSIMMDKSTNWKERPTRPKICSHVPLLNNDCLSEQRWYYDVRANRCFEFQSGSNCDSNGNNFYSKSDCETVCRTSQFAFLKMKIVNELHCGLPSVNVRHCRPEQWPKFRFYHDTASGSCSKFPVNSCATQHTLVSLKDCAFMCRQPDFIPELHPNISCVLPRVNGFKVCSNGQPRWFYDRKSGQCLWFMYNGCFGNWNNFLSQEACQRTCGESQFLIDICHLPADVGVAFQQRARYYFDPVRFECRHMQYTGHGGNANNFYTPEECEAQCLNNEADKSPFLEGEMS